MNKKKLFAVSVALFALSACTRKVTETAPDFTLEDLEGRPVSLSDFRGKVVAIEFFASWCAPCREAVPDMMFLFKKYKGRGFEFIAISADSDRAAAAEFAKEYRITYPVLLGDRRVIDLFNVMNVPTTFIIDKNGRISKKHAGYMPNTASIMSREIEALL